MRQQKIESLSRKVLLNLLGPIVAGPVEFAQMPMQRLRPLYKYS